MKGQNETIVPCIMSGESDCCTLAECSMYRNCYPDAYRKIKKKKKRNGKP